MFRPLLIVGAAAAVVLALLRKDPPAESPEPDWKAVDPS
jgi:hypothetical protein